MVSVVLKFSTSQDNNNGYLYEIPPLSETFFSVCERTKGLPTLINRNKEKIHVLRVFVGLETSPRVLTSFVGAEEDSHNGFEKKFLCKFVRSLSIKSRSGSGFSMVT